MRRVSSILKFLDVSELCREEIESRDVKRGE